MLPSETDVVAELTRPKARIECYSRLIAAAQALVETFSQINPEWITDERGQKGIELYYFWLGDVLELLDEYSIERLPDGPLSEDPPDATTHLRP